MRPYRFKYDGNAPFQLIQDAITFQTIKSTDQLFPKCIDHAKQRDDDQDKHDIVVPKISIIQSPPMRKSFAVITPNYIRLSEQLNLPKSNDYELTEVDLVFQNSHVSRFMLQGIFVLTKDFLRKAIMELETKAGKRIIIPRNKEWLTAFVSREYPSLLSMPNFEVFASVVYNYWKTRREELRFPIFRPLWRPSQNQYGHMLAFKARQKETRNLRRANRMVEDEIAMDLYEQFDIAMKVADRIGLRQDLKVQNMRQAINSFYYQVGNFDNFNSKKVICLDDDEDVESRLLTLQVSCRKMEAEMDNYRLKSNILNLEGKEEVKNNLLFDQPMSMVNFLATVVNEAESLGIGHENIFCTGEGLQKQNKCLQSLASGELLCQSINKEEMKGISLQRNGNFLVRSFQTHQEQIPNTVHESYMEYKRKKVSRCYFGSDDQNDSIDLRKNIANSFKKFMHL